MDARISAQLRTLAAASQGEVCGALVGNAATVLEAWPLQNRSAERARSFLIAAQDVLRVERTAEARGLAVIGFYHSHPQGDAAPSAADVIDAVPGYVYLIVANDGDMRGWRLREDRSGFDEVPV